MSGTTTIAYGMSYEKDDSLVIPDFLGISPIIIIMLMTSTAVIIFQLLSPVQRTVSSMRPLLKSTLYCIWRSPFLVRSL